MSQRLTLRARPQAPEDVTARGILKRTFAAKLRECARIAVAKFDGDLGTAIRGPVGARLDWGSPSQVVRR